MIPKLASHLLQLKSQGTHHIRNVIQSSGSTSSTSLSWSGIGSSSSSWGGSTGAGGAKFNAGSRFYAGYTGPGRVLTQATSVTGSDGSNSQLDDSEEKKQSLRANALSPHATRIRPRRNSFSVAARLPGPEGPSSQQASSIHTQVRGAFSTDNANAESSFVPESSSPTHRTTRRNSTSAVERPQSPVDDASTQLWGAEVSALETDADSSSQSVVAETAVETLPTQQEPDASVSAESQLDSSSEVSELQSLESSTSSTGPESIIRAENSSPATNLDTLDAQGYPQSAAAAEARLQASFSPEDKERYDAIATARVSGSIGNVLKEIRAMRKASYLPSVATYNMALYALNFVRNKGTPIALSLELYNEMVARNLVPNARTYENVIRALCERDMDIHALLDADPSTSAITKERSLFGRPVEPEGSDSTEFIEKLKEEPNFHIAMTLFVTAKNARYALFPTDTYNQLLRSAAFRGDVDAALSIYAHLEARRDISPNMATFAHLLSVYGQSGDLEGAREVFKEFEAAGRTGKLAWAYRKPGMTPKEYRNLVYSGRGPVQLYVQVYNRMISVYFKCGEPAGALALLEEMMKAENLNPEPGDIPSPSASTYTAIIQGFCESGDLDSAVTWFERLLTHKTVAKESHTPMNAALRPERQAWTVISKALISAGKPDTLNRLFGGVIAPLPNPSFQLTAGDVHQIVAANMKFLLSDEAPKDVNRSSALITSLLEVHSKCVELAGLSASQDFAYLWLVLKALVRVGQIDEANVLMETLVTRELQEIDAPKHPEGVRVFYTHGFKRSLLEYANDLMGTDNTGLQLVHRPTLDHVFSLFNALHTANIEVPLALWAALVRMYVDARRVKNSPDFMLHRQNGDWVNLTSAFCALEKVIGAETSSEANELARGTVSAILGDSISYPGLESLLQDIAALRDVQAALNVRPTDLVPVYEDLSTVYGPERARQMLLPLGHFGEQAIADGLNSDIPAEPETDPYIEPSSEEIRTQSNAPPLAKAPRVVINQAFSTELEKALSSTSPSVRDPGTLCQEVISHAQRGKYPSPESLSRLICACGRLGTIEKVRALYGIGQTLLASLADNVDWQTRGWFTVEDAMIIAHAFAGDIESANLHRTRILEQGGKPSSEAYAVLILKVQDYTDDCSVAMAYYNEARNLGVIPSAFLYNNIISKLARARKAETALAIFHEMRQSRVMPTSVTYGALIGACCRVGDADSAQYLFNEMSSQVNFRPKAPPFNTMIQFFVHTKPDRERALYYYDLMVTASVRPTAHTFKLLMDLYGTIEPVDMTMVEKTFTKLTQRRDVAVQGTHWASLITAWGCSSKDIDRAQAIFDSIATHPTTVASGAKLPDAPAWEALINVLVSQHRFDLLPSALRRLQDSEVHMTAYIANVIIRGYAASRRIERAREVFESLQDPPAGYAAVYNHASSAGTDEDVAADAPVYREPSTWETMVRAEMGSGERARAEELLVRMEARHFPSAVEARIRSIVGMLPSVTDIPNMLNLARWDPVHSMPTAVIAPPDAAVIDGAVA